MPTLKYSRQREAIKSNILSRHDHPTADMVLTDLRKIHPNVSLGTVYRNLSLLSEMGDILRIPTPSGADHFDGNIEPHNHFVCRRCSRVLDLDFGDKQLHDLSDTISGQFEGSIENCIVLFTGLCPSCREETT